MKIDFSQKMRPPGPKFKTIEHEPKPSGGTLYFTNKAEIYEVMRELPNAKHTAG